MKNLSPNPQSAIAPNKVPNSSNDEYVDPSDYLDADSIKEELLLLVDELQGKLSDMSNAPEADSLKIEVSLTAALEVRKKIESIFHPDFQRFVDLIKAQDKANEDLWDSISY